MHQLIEYLGGGGGAGIVVCPSALFCAEGERRYWGNFVPTTRYPTPAVFFYSTVLSKSKVLFFWYIYLESVLDSMY